MTPLLLLGAVMYGPQVLERVRGKTAPAPAEPFADLFVWHLRQVGTALDRAQRGGGLVAVGVARGHVEGARQIFAQLPRTRKSEAASAVKHAQDLVQRVQSALTRPVEVPPAATAPEAVPATAEPHVLKFAPR